MAPKAKATTASAGTSSSSTPMQYHMLPYEEQIVQEMLEENSLCVMAAGLAWHKVVAAMLKMQDSAANGVVLILGATSWQRQLIVSELARADSTLQPPADINNEVPAWQRLQLYNVAGGSSSSNNNAQQRGSTLAAAAAAPGSSAAAAAAMVDEGQAATDTPPQQTAVAVAANRSEAAPAAAAVSSRRCAACFVTTRILVVDILSHRIRPQQIAGMIILNAHRVTETSGEGFAVRLYRLGTGQGLELGHITTGNSTGFVRAFSDNAIAFASGFNKVEKVMKALRVRRLMLFPRFHASVKDSLEAHASEFEEWEVDPSPSQLSLSEAVREVLSALLKDLGRSNAKLDLADLTAATARGSDAGALLRPLDRAVRQQLEPLWHTLSWRSRTAVRDLASVQALAGQLMTYDPVTFLSYLEGLRLSEAGSSIWLYHEATHIIYEQARRRVYRIVYPHLEGAAAAASAAVTAAGSKNKRGQKRGRTAAAAAAAGDAGGSRATKAARSSSDASAPAAATAAAAAAEPAAAAARIEPVLECPPKWELLLELLHEVQNVRHTMKCEAESAEEVPEGQEDIKPPPPQQQQQCEQQRQQQQQQAGADVIDLADSDDAQDDVLHSNLQEQQQQQPPGPKRLTAAAISALLAAAAAPVLVVCRELHIMHLLQQVIAHGPTAIMQQQFKSYLRAQLSGTSVGGSSSSRGRGRGRGSNRSRGRRGDGRGRGRGGPTAEPQQQQQQQGGAMDPQQQQQQQQQGFGVGLSAVQGRAGSSRARGRRGTVNRGAGYREVIWAGRGPSVAAAEQQALLAAARELQQESQQQQHQQQQDGVAATAAAVPMASASSRGPERGDMGSGSDAAAGRGIGRRRGVQQQQQQRRQQRSSVSSDDGWESSSEEEGEQDTVHLGRGADVPAAGLQQQQRRGRQIPIQQHQQQQQQQQEQQTSKQQQQQRRQQRDPQQQQQQQQQQPIVFYALDTQDPAVLWRVQPGFIIMYDADLAFLRHVEVYQAELRCIPHQPPARVYQAYYAASPDKAAFHAAVTRESNMFGDLIRAKQHLVLPIDMGQDNLKQLLPPLQEQTQALQLQQRGRSALAPGPNAPNPNDLWLDVYSANALTRVGGLGRRLKPVPCKLVVDVREFMSGLPAVLHQQGFRITPVTLEVGDYVLSPEIVVERKALPDLFASLGSGRLYHQAESMTKSYKTPTLLIEFDGDKAFCLTGSVELADSLDSRSPQARLVLLLLHFPKLRLLWSRSQHATGELFLALKRNQEEPDAAAAALVGLPAAAIPAAAAAAVGDAAAAGTSAVAAVSGVTSGNEIISSTMVSPGTAAASLIAHQAQTAASHESVVNQAAIDMLRRLPGVTDVNWRSIINGCSSLRELTTISVQRLQELMGSSRGAKALHDFLHAPCPVAQTLGVLQA